MKQYVLSYNGKELGTFEVDCDCETEYIDGIQSIVDINEVEDDN